MKVDKNILTEKFIDNNGNVLQLFDLLAKNKYLVLYFYPKDNTPGCTMEAKDFRDNLEQFKRLNAVIVGVSRDEVQMHQHFANKCKLNFQLLADINSRLCQAFGVLAEKTMFGKKYIGIIRSTFIINSGGEVMFKWERVKVKNHVAEVLKFLAEL